MLFISLSSILQWTVLPINNTFLWWCIYLMILIIIYKANKANYERENNNNFLWIRVFILWNIVCIVRGLFVAEDYWEWKHLIGTAMVLLLPIITYISTDTLYVQKILASWVKYVFPTFFAVAFFIDYGAYGRYLIPISYLLLFFPLLKTNWKIICLLVGFLVITIDLGARSNVIKFLMPLLLSLIFYLRSYFLYRLLIFGRLFFLYSPFVLLVLAITNTFNIFKISDYIEGDYTVETKSEWKGDGDLTVDTRTFLYEEVLYSAIKYDYVIFGRTPARGNESPSFGPQIDKELNRDKNERFTNEVGVANIFTWTGLLGVILNFMIFFKASSLGLRKSNSWCMKIVAIYICFRWFYSWIEDFSRFDLSTVFLWICIGMCLSKSFRNLSDKEFKYWVQGVFDKRLRFKILKRVAVR